jgi:hypothetical protein
MCPATPAFRLAAGWGAEGTCNWRVRIVLDPVQDGIGKDSVEFVLKDQRTGILCPRVKAEPKSGCDHVRRIVDAHRLRTQRNQLFGQCAVAATQILGLQNSRRSLSRIFLR